MRSRISTRISLSTRISTVVSFKLLAQISTRISALSRDRTPFFRLTPACGYYIGWGGPPCGAVMEDFESVPESKVSALDEKFEQICSDLRPTYEYIDRDPYLCITDNVRRAALLKRFLLSEELNIEKAAARLRATVEFRRDWNVQEYHEPGAASKLIPEASNPGAEIYFADSLRTDKDGLPFLVGRIGILNLVSLRPSPSVVDP